MTDEKLGPTDIVAPEFLEQGQSAFDQAPFTMLLSAVPPDFFLPTDEMDRETQTKYTSRITRALVLVDREHFNFRDVSTITRLLNPIIQPQWKYSTGVISVFEQLEQYLNQFPYWKQYIEEEWVHCYFNVDGVPIPSFIRGQHVMTFPAYQAVCIHRDVGDIYKGWSEEAPFMATTNEVLNATQNSTNPVTNYYSLIHSGAMN